MPVGVGLPTLRIDGITVGGTAAWMEQNSVTVKQLLKTSAEARSQGAEAAEKHIGANRPGEPFASAERKPSSVPATTDSASLSTSVTAGLGSATDPASRSHRGASQQPVGSPNTPRRPSRRMSKRRPGIGARRADLDLCRPWDLDADRSGLYRATARTRRTP